MTAPNQLPDGVAPRVVGLASEFAAIRHSVEEAARHSPPIVAADDLNFIRPETSTNVAAFVAPWANFGGGFSPAAYATIGTRVFLRGLVISLGAVTGPYPIFHLPAGLWPALQELFICTIGGGAAIRVDIYPNDGAVAIGNGTSVAANTYVSLSGLSFSTLA